MDSTNNPSIPISNLLIRQEFTSMTVPFKKTRYYVAEEVDKFLSTTATDVKQLENVTKKLLEYYDDTKGTHSQKTTVEKVAEVAKPDHEIDEDITVANSLKQREARIERMQSHITELLENAEAKAEEIVNAAMREAAQITETAKHRGIEIINNAQLESDKLYRVGQEKIEEAKLIKTEIASQTAIIQADINTKAEQIEDLANVMVDMSSKLRNLNNGVSA